MLMWLFIVVQVIAIDLILSGDNAVVIAGATKTLPVHLRNPALVGGIILAFLARILLVSVAGALIHIKIISVAAGIMLFWVAWKMIKNVNVEDNRVFDKTGDMVAALSAIVLADLSMSVDNIVAIAGLTRGHPMAMVFGLAVSLAVLGACAKYGCTLLEKYRWLNYVGAGLVGAIGVSLLI